MKALQFSAYGPPATLSIKEFPKPVPRKGEVLIEVKASAINPSDVKNVAGHFHSPLPRVPGRDYAGVVVGGDARPGLEVWGTGAGFGVARDGAHTEYIVLPVDWISEKPAKLSMEEAAAVGVPYLAAWCALVQSGNLQPGETVVIVGASGSVGRAATEIAHWKKAHVIGADRTPSTRSKVDFHINTATQDLGEQVRAATGGKGAGLVLDTVGGAMFERALKALAIGGRQVAIASGTERTVSFDLVDFYHNCLHLIGVDTAKLTGPEIAGIMNALRTGFQEGYFEAPEVKTWPLGQAVQAYEAVEKGDHR